MNNTQMIRKHDKAELKPYLYSHFERMLEKTREDIRNSEEFNEKKKEYLTTTEYSDFVNNIDENVVDIFLEHLDLSIKNFYKGKNDEDFSKFVRAFISSEWHLRHDLNIPFLSCELSFNCTKENYKSKIEDLIEDAIETEIEKSKVHYANGEFNLNTFYTHMHYYEKLDALLPTMDVSTDLKDYVEKVNNNFDFKEIVTRKDKFSPPLNI
jgi:DNA topoisomerase VI subunit B